jgi:hypothetical protein
MEFLGGTGISPPIVLSLQPDVWFPKPGSFLYISKWANDLVEKSECIIHLFQANEARDAPLILQIRETKSLLKPWFLREWSHDVQHYA